MALTDKNRIMIDTAIADHNGRPGALLPILHAVQNEVGYIPTEATAMIAGELNLSRAEVHGVISFYHYFRTSPPGRHNIQICQAESCQAMGGAALTEHAKSLLKIDFHETGADQKFSLEPVYCLGNCACSPAIMIDDEIYGRVTPDRLEKLLAAADGEQS